MDTIKFNGSHEGAEIRSKQESLTLEQQKNAVESINQFVGLVRLHGEEIDYDGLLKNIQSLIDDYQNACHARAYSGVK